MPELKYTLFDTDRGAEPKIRTRFETESFIEYIILAEDVLNWPTLPLRTIAYKFYGDESLWEVIADANPIKPSWQYAQGDVIVIPRDFQQAFKVSFGDEDLRRKIF